MHADGFYIDGKSIQDISQTYENRIGKYIGNSSKVLNFFCGI